MADVVRTSRVSWLTHPPGGHAAVTVGSRAFTALPLSFSMDELEPGVTTPGELLVAAHGGALAVILARMLERDGIAARELVVSTTYRMAASEWYEIATVEIAVSGRVPGASPADVERVAHEAAERCRSSTGLAGNAAIEISVTLL
jgi:organic hydroperoxide reductase OsmC/OhrA